MQGQMPSRKRAAPGASPMPPQQAAQGFNNVNFGNFADTSFDSNNQFLNSNMVEGINGAGNPYGDPSNFDSSFLNTMTGNMSAASANAASNQLIRRNANQQLAARGDDGWADFDGTGQVSEWNNNEGNEEDLETRALAAKKDAQAKRKQIPPFVQKLSSFLDESKNTDLIRWSDDGNSFIVLDEDEFAKTLIPELFKHNNYASFVRQLNMYGFHKRVGLSDNSMKASENKRKTPSEYYNEFFKRGRPELLWLIQKPKNATTSGKRKKGDKDADDSDEEGQKYLPDTKESLQGPQGVSTGNRKDLITLPKTELDAVRQELRQLQTQQRFISSVISQVKRQNDQLYQQASAFQTLHDRHENSINAILTFLATFYNRSLEGQQGNIADMFSHAIPDSMQQHGNVVDVGDVDDASIAPQNQTRSGRRPLALLPAPDTANSPVGQSRVSPVTASPSSAANSRKASIFRPANPSQGGRSRTGTAQPDSSTQSSTPVVKNEAPTPNTVDLSESGTSPSADADQMMSVIQAANNATPKSTSFDFPAALANYQTANGASPLTQQQKNDMLSMIAKSQPASANNSNNALVNSNMPEVPNLSQFTKNQESLDYLQQIQADNERRVQSLAERLTPLSPSGSIPGLDFEGNSTLGPQMGAPGSQPPDWDLNDFINSQDYFTGATLPEAQNAGTAAAGGNGDLDLFNFDSYNADAADGTSGLGNFNDDELFGSSNVGFDGAGDSDTSHLTVGDHSGGGRVESVASSEPASPADAGEQNNTPAISGDKSPAKRRRVG